MSRITRSLAVCTAVLLVFALASDAAIAAELQTFRAKDNNATFHLKLGQTKFKVVLPMVAEMDPQNVFKLEPKTTYYWSNRINSPGVKEIREQYNRDLAITDYQTQTTRTVEVLPSLKLRKRQASWRLIKFDGPNFGQTDQSFTINIVGPPTLGDVFRDGADKVAAVAAVFHPTQPSWLPSLMDVSGGR